MEKELYADLVQSLKEAKEISHGNASPSRRIVFSALDVRRVREKTGLSQTQFANMICVSVRTLQNWEQGRRSPNGPAAALLRVVSDAPHLVKETLQV
jgi:DNA-binding transcriptional regulator YiaG